MRHVILIILAILMLPAATATGAPKDDFTVVIDAGHGGKDAGALGAKTNEKTINITVAKKLARLFEKEMKDAKVYMTRDADYFVTLQGRADFANKKKASVFISIHANSLPLKSPSRPVVHGASVYTCGLDRSETNLRVAMRENEVMKLEDDYTTVYEGFDPSSAESYIVFEMMQHKNMDQSIALADAVLGQLNRVAGRKNNGVRQAPLWVLVRTSMPAILVELDYISNPTAEKYMMSDEGTTRLAQAIFNGVKHYRSTNGKLSPRRQAQKEVQKEMTESPSRETAPAAEKPAKEKSEAKPKAEKTGKTEKASGVSGEVTYCIQFLVGGSKALAPGAAAFKGLEGVEHYRDGGVYKYTVGSYPSQAEALKALPEVKKKFRDAFVIKMRDGKRIK